MASRLEKLAVAHNLTVDKMVTMLRDSGMAPWNIQKLAEYGDVNQPAPSLPPPSIGSQFSNSINTAAAPTSAPSSSIGGNTAPMGGGPEKKMLSTQGQTKTSAMTIINALSQKKNNEVEKQASSVTDDIDKLKLQELQRKNSFLGRFAEAAPAAGVTLAASGALIGGAAIVRKMKQRSEEKNKELHYHAMIKSNPDLKAQPEAKVREYHEILHNFSPHIAKNPHLAGSWVRSHLRYSEEGVPLESVKSLVDVHEKHEHSHGDSVEEANRLMNISSIARNIANA